jgi:hypothetical protein
MTDQPSPRCWHSVCNLVLCHALCIVSEAGFVGYNSSIKFLDPKSAYKQSVWMAVQDIEDNKFWKCLYILLHSVFSALRALCFCNASQPVMDKIFFLSHRTTQVIERSQEFLNDSNLFGTLTMDSNLIAEGNVILGSNDGDIGNEEAEEVVYKETPPTEDKFSGNEDDDSNKGESVVTMLFGAAVHWRCGACLGGSKSNTINLILRLFLYQFLHMMSS